MSKYFKEDTKIQLGDYRKRDLSDRMKRTVDYLIHCLGDVALSIDIIEAYNSYFFSYGGRYDVRGEVESVKGLYEIYKKFPSISSKAFSEISFRYIKDLFDIYSLDSVLEKLIKVYGKTDEAMELFIMYIDKKADELQSKYEKEASKLDKYIKLYSDDGLTDGYISYLKHLVIEKHMSVDKIIDSMPSQELIKKDREHLYHISKTSHCFMGCGYPASYLMTESYVKDADLSKYGQRPTYYISASDEKKEATFTTQEFIDSVNQEKVKRLTEKK